MYIFLLLAVTGMCGALLGQDPSLSVPELVYHHAGSKISLIRHSPKSLEIKETYGAMRFKTCVFGATACLSAALGAHYYSTGKSYLFNASPCVGGLLGVSTALVSGYIYYRLRTEEHEGIIPAQEASRALHAHIEKKLGLSK